MKRVARLAAAAALTVLASCETTGNPREGGLFGWSETKAQDRQARKQSRVAGAQTELAHETVRGAELRTREEAANDSLIAAAKQRIHTEQLLQSQQARLVTKTKKLEEDSPTDAMASRARSYRLKVNTIVAQTSLTPQQRAERLHVLEAEIDAAQTRLK